MKRWKRDFFRVLLCSFKCYALFVNELFRFMSRSDRRKKTTNSTEERKNAAAIAHIFYIRGADNDRRIVIVHAMCEWNEDDCKCFVFLCIILDEWAAARCCFYCIFVNRQYFGYSEFVARI